MVESCCALNCTNRRTKGVKFHRIPKDPNLRKLWLLAIRRANFDPSERTTICEKHFTLVDYEVNVHGNKVLKKTAIPSVFDFPIPKLEDLGEDLGSGAEISEANGPPNDEASEAEPSTLSDMHAKPDSPNLCTILETKATRLRTRREPVAFEDFRLSDLNNIQLRKRFWKVAHETISKYKKVNKYYRCKIRRQNLKIKSLNSLLDEQFKPRKISSSQPFVVHSSFMENPIYIYS